MEDREYRSFNEIEQAKTLWEKGELLATREDDLYKILLYQLYDIYIEVSWDKHSNIIKKVSTFTTTDHLEPYLQSINIDFLLS